MVENLILDDYVDRGKKRGSFLLGPGVEDALSEKRLHSEG